MKQDRNAKKDCKERKGGVGVDKAPRGGSYPGKHVSGDGDVKPVRIWERDSAERGARGGGLSRVISGRGGRPVTKQFEGGGGEGLQIKVV